MSSTTAAATFTTFTTESEEDNTATDHFATSNQTSTEYGASTRATVEAETSTIPQSADSTASYGSTARDFSTTLNVASTTANEELTTNLSYTESSTESTENDTISATVISSTTSKIPRSTTPQNLSPYTPDCDEWLFGGLGFLIGVLVTLFALGLIYYILRRRKAKKAAENAQNSGISFSRAIDAAPGQNTMSNPYAIETGETPTTSDANRAKVTFAESIKDEHSENVELIEQSEQPEKNTFESSINKTPPPHLKITISEDTTAGTSPAEEKQRVVKLDSLDSSVIDLTEKEGSTSF